MDSLKLGKKEIEVVPMTWKTQKQVFKVITKALDGIAQTPGLMKKAISQAMEDGQVSTSGFLKVIESLPDALDEVLTVGLGLQPGDLDEATGLEVAKALQAWAQVNELQAQMDALKNGFALLGMVQQGDKAQEAVKD